MLVTAYCPCEKCCSRDACGLTATGVPAKGLIVAVDPRRVRLGSIVAVPGYGAALACDTGRLVKGGRLDVLLPTHEEAKAWGTRRLCVEVMTAEEWRWRCDMERRYNELVESGRKLMR